MMAVVDKAGAIRIWNLSNVNLWPLVIKENASIGSLSFSPDESQLLCAMKEKDFTIHVWSLAMDTMSKELCSFLKQNMTVEEWDQYIGEDIPYMPTCKDFPPKK